MASFNINLGDLPAELLYKIFNNLSAVDIYFHISLVNHRLRAVVLSYSHFELVTNDPKFKLLCSCLSPSQISSLRLFGNQTALNSISFQSFFSPYCSRVQECPVDCFFTLYQGRLSQFDRLRVLDLTGIPDEYFSQVIDRLIQSMPQLALTLYQINDRNTVYSDVRIEHFVRFILTLQYVRQISLYKPDALLALMSAVPLIEHIDLESCTTLEMRKLKEYRPNLRCLNVKQININDSSDEKSATVSSNSVVTISNNRIVSKFLGLEISFVKQILFVDLHPTLSTLTHLSLQQHAIINQNFDEFFDGSWWESSLKMSMPLLKSFAFEFAFGYPHRALTLDDINVMLMPFRTDYWLKEKQWYVNFISLPAHGSRLFTHEFQRDRCEMTNVNSSLKISTNASMSVLQETMTELTIDYSAGDPSINSLRFGTQVCDLYIRGPMARAESPSNYLSLNNHIRPYVDYCNVQRLRLGASIAREDKKQLKAGFVRLFRNVTCLKIDRMEHLQSLLVQRKKAIDLLTNQLYVLKIVEATDWWFWRDRRSIDDFCRVFVNLKQLDLNVRDSPVMVILIDGLLNLEEVIFRFSQSVEEIFLEKRDLCLFKTRLRHTNWSYEIFRETVHIYVNAHDINSDCFGSHERIVSRPRNYHPSLSGEDTTKVTWGHDDNGK